MASVVNIINTITSQVIYLRTLDHFWVEGDTITKGNNAVVARGRIIGREGLWRIKCYIRPKTHLRQIYGDEYYPQELGVYSIDGKMEYIDLVVQPWVEGTPLDRYIGHEDSDYAALSRAFDSLALKLLDADYAHGDIKPENIIVSEDMTMTLIDHDAMWRPEFKIYTADEIGTEGYKHPKRDSNHYTKTIDDYPLAIISTMLASLALDYPAMIPYLKLDKTMFDPELCICDKDSALRHALQLFAEHNDAAHYRIAEGLLSTSIAIYNLRNYFSYTSTTISLPLPLSIVPEYSGHLWGYRSNDGWVLPPLYELCKLPRNGICVVTLGGIEHELEYESDTYVDPHLNDQDIEQEIERRSKLIAKIRADITPLTDIITGHYFATSRTTPHTCSNRHWSRYEEELMVCFIADGHMLHIIARLLGRSELSVRRRIKFLDVPMPKKPFKLRKARVPRKYRKV